MQRGPLVFGEMSPSWGCANAATKFDLPTSEDGSIACSNNNSAYPVLHYYQLLFQSYNNSIGSFKLLIKSMYKIGVEQKNKSFTKNTIANSMQNSSRIIKKKTIFIKN